ncbi:MAG: hypothetical protein A2901_01395 [Elusimicrobia bacterium RIFCSPLOWO2_01_FULL_54_10]|nr:MAG: hypothetical protein A2901_01395 [Elusimicrobia bacterium RIFCSPLOWO2_01_FULL_54_10]
MKFRLPSDDARYFSDLLRQFRENRKTPAFEIGVNFFPSALLSPADRGKLLGAEEYENLVLSRKAYEAAAASVQLTLSPMNGGIGTSLRREEYLRRIWPLLGRKGPVQLGAKGSDLFFALKYKGRRGLVSISEAKILRVMHERTQYAKIILQQLTSPDTLPSVRRLLGTVNIFHRMGLSTPFGKKTYAQILSRAPGLGLRPVRLQAALPTLDEKGKVTVRRKAPGGHGFWGQKFICDYAKEKGINAIYNEDGINNLVDPVVVGWMAKKKIAAVMLTTTKTDIDKKGGLIGILKAGGAVKKEILEEAQTKTVGQGDLFAAMGLTEGEKGGQYFNTNTAILNYAVLTPFLTDLAKVIGKDKIEENAAPRLIQNKKGEFIQLEGALGSCLLNLDGFFQTSQDPELRKVLKKHGRLGADGRVDFLRILNVGEENRMLFFTPIKTADDFRLQFQSGGFSFSTDTWMLEKVGPGSPPIAPWNPQKSDGLS